MEKSFDGGDFGGTADGGSEGGGHEADLPRVVGKEEDFGFAMEVGMSLKGGSEHVVAASGGGEEEEGAGRSSGPCGGPPTVPGKEDG